IAATLAVGLVAGGTAVRDSSGWLGRLDSMAVLVPSDVWFTERATDFAVSESGLRIDSLVVVGSTTAVRLLSVGTAGFGGPSTLSGRFEGLQVRDILGLMQLDSALGSGTLSGSYELAGNAVSPEIRLAVVASDARWLRFPSPDVRVTAEYSHRTVEGSLEMVRLGLQLLHLDLTLPVDLAFVPVDRRLVEGDLRITARADGMDLSIVEAMTSSVRDTRGRLDMDAAVSGTWADPSLSGTITLRDGGARFPSINATHSDLFARALLAGDTIYIDSLSVKSGEGTALIGGYIHLVEATAPVLDLRVTTRDFHTLSIPNFLDLTGSADLRVTGPVFDAHVTGTGGVSSGVLFFADLLEKQIINLEDTLFAGVVDTSLASTIRRQGLGAAFSTRFFDSLTVDSIRIDTGQDMWLRSQEANILLTGNVLARKTGSQYRLDGVLNTPRGIYTLPVIGSREFNVTRGEIRYQGSPDLDAEIDVEARYPVRTITGDIVTVFVRLGGTIYAPTVTLTSDITPAIPETEIVSYLISGGPTIGGGPAAARMAANVAAALSGQLQSLVGLGIPIDYFQFRPVEGSSEAFSLTGAELIIGKQLFNSDLFVTANPLFCRTGVEIGAVNLEYRFNPEWRFSLNRDLVRSACQAATGAGNAPTYQLGLDLFWEKSY
ncbi:MAG: translocation/assembly module TamB domain-containing protein, partial [Gemmatimonadales bacterium]